MSRPLLAVRSGRWAAIAFGATLPVSVVLDNLLIAVILVCWLAADGLAGRIAALRSQPVAWAAAALLLLLILGCGYGLGDAGDNWHFLRKYSHLLLLPVLLSLPLEARDKQRALIAFGIAMTVTLLLSYAYWWRLLPMPPGRSPDNPVVFKLHITHGLLMAYAAFLATVAALEAHAARTRRLLGAAAAAAAFNVLFMIHGRTGYLILALLAGYLCFARYRWRGLALAAAGAGAAVAFAWAIDAPMIGRLAATSIEYRQWQGGGGETSIGARLDFYRYSLAIFLEHPLTGVGTGGFIAAYAAKIAGSGAIATNNPHNQYLLVAVQLGLPGLLALLALFLVAWRQAARLESWQQHATRGALLTIAAGCLFNSLLIDHTEGLFFSWLLGLMFSAPAPSSSPRRRPPPTAP